MKIAKYYTKVSIFTLLFYSAVISQGKDLLINYSVSKEVDSLLYVLALPDVRTSLTEEERTDKKKRESVSVAFLEKANVIIKSGKLPSNTEFQTYFYCQLGIYTSNKKEYDKAIKYYREAIELSKKLTNFKSKAYQAEIKLFLIFSLSEINNYAEAITLSKELIENYQGVGSGNLKNAVSVKGVVEYVDAAKKGKIDSAEIQKYLSSISEQYNNDVGCSADFEIYLLAKEQADISKAKQIKEKILSRYPKTQEFTNIYQSYFDLEEKKQSN